MAYIMKKGFTLIELLVVISIIGLLSSIVLASVSNVRADARDARRISDLRQLQTALQLYAEDNGGLYPSTGSISTVYMDPGCTQSVSSPHQKTPNWIPGLTTKYIGVLPRDPKPISGGCYMYSSNGQKFLLTAYATIENTSNGGKLDSNFGYRETNYMNAPACYYSVSYPSIDAVHRKSFTITNLVDSDVNVVCSALGPLP